MSRQALILAAWCLACGARSSDELPDAQRIDAEVEDAAARGGAWRESGDVRILDRRRDFASP